MTLPLVRLVPLPLLRERKYSNLLCYPSFDAQEASKRIRELKSLGIKALEFSGEKTAFNLPVLGKGCVGIVVIAHVSNQDDEKMAVKIRRVDADRVGMEREANLLQIANKIGVGPRVLGSSENFLLMELVEGDLIPQWIEKLSGKGTRNRLRRILLDILGQCRQLDLAGLDHGELNRAPRHIIIDNKDNAHLMDFEAASVHRRASNVTSVCQYLFIGSQTAKNVLRKLGKIDQDSLRLVLRSYKKNPTKENFDKILSQCGLVKANNKK